MQYYDITRCYLPPGRSDILAFTPAKLILDLAIPEGCKAELILVDHVFRTRVQFGSVSFPT